MYYSSGRSDFVLLLQKINDAHFPNRCQIFLDPRNCYPIHVIPTPRFETDWPLHGNRTVFLLQHCWESC